MNALDELLQMDECKKTVGGVRYTPQEIAQQPLAWRQTVDAIRGQAAGLADFMRRALETRSRNVVHLVGAGTSHFVGESVRNLLAQAWPDRIVAPVASTEVVVAPTLATAQSTGLMVSFARSGQSPEGNAALRLVQALRPTAAHLAITCNSHGELAALAGSLGEAGYALVLPDITNDNGLAMTSSYSSMVVAGQALAYLDKLADFAALVERLAEAGAHVLASYAGLAKELAGTGFHRAVYIGNRDLYGVALESHLKMQEMTAGRVLCKAESTLGLRHGPLAALDERTLVVVFLSADRYVRQYEIDLLREIAGRRLGQRRIAVADQATPEITALVDDVVELAPHAAPLPDLHKAPAAIIFPQMLALFRSIAEGLSPDAPSPAGVINRVVQGVNIYPYQDEQEV